LFKALFDLKIYKYNQNNQPNTNKQYEPEGTVTINKKAFSKRKQKGEFGEYVDYEEIK
jgi:hypothetical protein